MDFQGNIRVSLLRIISGSPLCHRENDCQCMWCCHIKGVILPDMSLNVVNKSLCWFVRSTHRPHTNEGLIPILYMTEVYDISAIMAKFCQSFYSDILKIAWSWSLIQRNPYTVMVDRFCLLTDSSWSLKYVNCIWWKGMLRRVEFLFQKLQQKYSTDTSSFTTLQRMVMTEVDCKQHRMSSSATVALLWMKR
jgi:hypothetical protein